MSAITIDQIAERLAAKGVRPTANRISVYRTLSDAHELMSLSDIESALDTLDKSSIFRVLGVFADHDVVHVLNDGSGSVKYELCRVEGGHSPEDMHVHFHCLGCGRTFCFEEIHVPAVELPAGFVPRSLNYTMEGYCIDCSCRNR